MPKSKRMTMGLVEIKKGQLVETLKKNREEHRKVFEAAIEGWQITVKRKIDEIVERAKKDDYEQVFYQIPKPEDHTRDYDRAILMIEMDVSDTVELTDQEFAQYVQDDWGWKKQWTTSNTMYVAAAGRS